MTDQHDTDASTQGQEAGGDLFNTAAGWVLFAAGLGLGFSILSGKYFHGDDPQRPEQLGYVIEGVEEAGGDKPAEMTVAEALTLVSVEDGAKVFAKCSACHSIEAGGANGVGPNLHAIMGANVGAKPGFSYSSGMANHGGQWGWDEMDAWLKRPATYIEGTKMSFAGLSKIEDRAAVALYMNSEGSGLSLPEFTPVEEVASEEASADTAAVEEAETSQDDAEATSQATAEAEA
ncbi:MAG: c-type cytochrome [Erythrobacter sp.]|uniref:c-type cytochrome n=1 Tax=Erythrobacter sp. TaxID=1042 RepID=UPI00261455F4|nr:c-type cytochrome [Erythrobacter sp.]MDJ0979263.1 c-type cytochrome [Erythrobacter sp.]